jgi:hypothetical protein
LFRLIGFGRVSTRRTRRHLFFSLSIRFALPQRAKKRSIDRWERSLMSLSLFNNKGRNIEKEKKRL